ncbi:HEAT repeat domain-containing protein [Actinomadura sp. NPDC047616]|uniref:HEAT repeat domain-containing protein n=1 Tax=Actinomadura sp. NPDC047616 TaxID=3155914 RepID=UPI0033C3E8A0
MVVWRVLHLREHDDVLLPPLSRVALSGPGRARATALTMVAQRGRRDLAVAALTAAEPEVRQAAARILSRDPRPETADRLLAALDAERAPSVARVLLGVAGQCGDRGLAAAVRWLHDRDAGPVAAWAMGRIGTPGAVRRLRALVAGRTAAPPAVRGAAARALGAAGDRHNADLFTALLRDPDEAVRYQAALALTEYGRSHGGPPPSAGPEVTDHLTELSGGDSPRVRRAAADALRVLDPG